MTDALRSDPPKPKRRARSPHGPGLFVTDTELVELLGVPPVDARRVIVELDRNPRSGFPQKQKLWGDRRYLPAVKAYFEQVYGLKMDVPQSQERRRYG